ncbi:hypothetical protein HMPREF0208_02734 [Citrobacter koseri]|nr:hypothetical protein HMPREF0208_02734 [Citrobacter koseri]
MRNSTDNRNYLIKKADNNIGFFTDISLFCRMAAERLIRPTGRTICRPGKRSATGRYAIRHAMLYNG